MHTAGRGLGIAMQYSQNACFSANAFDLDNAEILKD